MTAAFYLVLALVSADPAAAGPAPPTLAVDVNFPAACAEVLELDSTRRLVHIQPAEHKDRGKIVWWYARVTGCRPGETITLVVTGSVTARPDRATFSFDNRTWRLTEPGQATSEVTRYSITAEGPEVWVAWGSPYVLSQAKDLVERIAHADVGATAFTLARSKSGRDVPALRWEPAAKPGEKRPGIWIQARQHAVETSSSWVCHGLVEWLASDDVLAKRLRERARIVVVPIMDVDNTERGAGGKDQKPHDHNRDWSDEPIWPEVAAAQKLIHEMLAAGEFDFFLDLHGPGRDDGQPFFWANAESVMSKERWSNQDRFVQLARENLSRQPLGLAPRVRQHLANDDPRWQAIASNYLAAHSPPPTVAITLEVAWNTPHSTAENYLTYGHALGRAVALYALGRP